MMRRKHNPYVALAALLLLALIITAPALSVHVVLLILSVIWLRSRINHHAEILRDSEEEK